MEFYLPNSVPEIEQNRMKKKKKGKKTPHKN